MTRWLAVGLLAAACAAAATPARADRDAVQLFSDIQVTPDAPVHDAVCFFCSVRVDGKVTGDIVVFFGSIHLNGEAQHDVVSFFGSVRAEDNSSIHQDLVNFFGSIRLGENVTVGKDMVSIFGGQHVAASAQVGGDRVRLPAIVFWGPVLFIFVVIVLVMNEVRSRHRRWAPPLYPPPPPMR